MKKVDFEGKKGFGKTETVDVKGEETFQAGEGVRHVIYREDYKEPAFFY